MKAKTKILVLFGSLVLLVFAMNVGMASADGPHLGDDTNGLDDSAPVGQRIVPDDAPGHPGAVNGFDNENSNATDAIANNPLCPLHPDD